MGIDRRFAAEIAGRFPFDTVLETCTGGGFSTMALARVAGHVVTIDVDPDIQAQARKNLQRAGLESKVTFLTGDALDDDLLGRCGPVDAAFLDPDWAVSGPDHVYRFRDSNTEPPADLLLRKALSLTPNVGLILPPLVDPEEFTGLPSHERQEMYLKRSHELTCLYFGELARGFHATECRVGG
jgi:hypothetical protein